MHKIYKDEGVFDFLYQIPQILYSTIISAFISFFIKFLSLSESSVIKLKNAKIEDKTNQNLVKLIKCIKIKLIFFYVFSFLFLILFWYYLSCFCAVYQNTQKYLALDTFVSFGVSFIYPIFINFIPGFLRIPSLKNSKQSKECLYKMSKILQII